MNPIDEIFTLLLTENDIQIWKRTDYENAHLCTASTLAGDIFNCLIEAKKLPLDTSVFMLTRDNTRKYFNAVLVRSAWFKPRIRRQEDLEELCAKALTTELKTTSTIRYDGEKYLYYDRITLDKHHVPDMSLKRVSLHQLEEVVSIKPIPYLGLPTDKTRICRHCGKIAENLKRCGRCKKIYYCNQEHQRADWKRHKEACV